MILTTTVWKIVCPRNNYYIYWFVIYHYFIKFIFTHAFCVIFTENIKWSFSLNVRLLPEPRRCVKFPCGICNKTAKNNHKAIQWDSCDLWIHRGCNLISDEKRLIVVVECLKTDDDLWHCLVCVLKCNLDNVRFT